MKKLKFTFSILSLVFILLLSSCYTTTHIVGSGGSTGEVVEKRQWFALFGLVPINTVDSKQMAGGKTDYTITTTHTFIDQLIGAFTSIVTVAPMTIQVKK